MQECLPGSIPAVSGGDHSADRFGGLRKGGFWLSSPRKRTFAAKGSPQSARHLRDIVPKDGGELPEVESVRCTWQP